MTHDFCTQTQSLYVLDHDWTPSLKEKLKKHVEAGEICWPHVFELREKMQTSDLFNEALKEFGNAPHPPLPAG